MRRLTILALFSAALFCTFAAPAQTARKVTATELEQLLSKTRKTSDSYLAEKISSYTLTERLSQIRLEALQKLYPGNKTHDALLALSGLAQPLALPTAELPPDPTPSMSEQQRIIKLAADTLVSKLHALPNFLADRKTTHYDNSVADSFYTFSGTNKLDTGGERQLRVVSRSTRRVAYRDGKEVIDSSAPGTRSFPSTSSQLNSNGEFGPVLKTILLDAPHGKLAWSHWERGLSGLEAHFSFHVPEDASHFEIYFPCANGSTAHFPAYSAEFAVNPATGDILRLQISATLPPPCPAITSTIITDYGPTQIGGHTYICPLHSVTLAQTLSANKAYQIIELNDVSFTSYRLFRAEARIVSFGDEPTPEPKR